MEVVTKEVDFFKYCRSCKHKKDEETKDPCNECLTYPMNIHTRKPMMYEEAK